MTIPTFDVDAMLRKEPTTWQERGLHWHCYSWRGSGAEWANDSARNSETAEVTPNVVKAWLRKPARLIRAAPATPEAAVEWLRGQWDAVKGEALHPCGDDEQFKFAFALYDLRCGNDLSWALWLRGQSIVSFGVVGTNAACH